MTWHQRCPDAKDNVCGDLVRTKKGGPALDNDHNTYKTCAKPQGCTKTGDTECKCFVVAMHVKLKDDDSEEITEEVTYPGSRIPNKNEEELLSIEKEKADSPGKASATKNPIGKLSADVWPLIRRASPLSLEARFGGRPHALGHLH